MAKHFKRHYRAYKNELKNSFPNQIQNIKRNKGKIICFSTLILLAAYAEGFLLGYFLGKRRGTRWCKRCD